MTRKHFNKIAATCRQTRPFTMPNSQSGRSWRCMVYSLGTICREANELFDRERFNRACGAIVTSEGDDWTPIPFAPNKNSEAGDVILDVYPGRERSK